MDDNIQVTGQDMEHLMEHLEDFIYTIVGGARLYEIREARVKLKEQLTKMLSAKSMKEVNGR